MSYTHSASLLSGGHSGVQKSSLLPLFIIVNMCELIIIIKSSISGSTNAKAVAISIWHRHHKRDFWLNLFFISVVQLSKLCSSWLALVSINASSKEVVPQYKATSVFSALYIYKKKKRIRWSQSILLDLFCVGGPVILKVNWCPNI